MKKRRFPKLLFLLFLLLIVAGLIFGISQKERPVGDQKEKTGLEQMADAARAVFDQEPEQVKKLREQETAQTEEGHQEYYFQLLKDQEKVIYRQMLQGIRERKEEFYLTSSEDEVIDRAYHAVLKDHPELFGSTTGRLFTGPRIRERITACFRPDILIRSRKFRRFRLPWSRDIRK